MNAGKGLITPLLLAQNLSLRARIPVSITAVFCLFVFHHNMLVPGSCSKEEMLRWDSIPVNIRLRTETQR